MSALLEPDDEFDPLAPKGWDPKSAQAASELLRKKVSGEIQFWYCKPNGTKYGRNCDGKPHPGHPYKHARADQWPPQGVDWFLWLILSGRGAGKTRTGAEWTRSITSRVERIALVGRRGPDVRSTMIEGESGLIKVCERAGVAYEWEPSKKEFTFANGAKAFGYSAEEPDTLRGPQHGAAWLDEPAHMPLIADVWTNLLMGLRLPGLPGGAKALCTSTPLPIPWLKKQLPKPRTRLVRVSTYINLENLDETFRENVLEQYEGTREGRQELHGEILEDVEGALWTNKMIDDARQRDDVGALIPFDRSMVEFERIVVGVDPAGTNTRRSDETGIVVVGKANGRWYVLDDVSGRYNPSAWALRVVAMFEKWSADRVVAEKNYGGDMVEQTLRNVEADLPITLVTSRRGKLLRAEPIAALYEQGKVVHTAEFTKLESQMTEWVPGEGDSPDRVDALVHAITSLSNPSGPSEVSKPSGPMAPAGPSASGLDALAYRRVWG